MLAIKGSYRLPSPQHTGDDLDLGDTVRITQNDTDLRRRSTLSGELADLLNNLFGGGLQPGGSGARVGDGGGRNALALAVKSTHLGCEFVVVVEDEVDGCRRSCCRKSRSLVWSLKIFA